MTIKKTITCIICPKGCKIDIWEEENKLNIIGYSCKRGKDYAISEYYNPSRVLTTTIQVKGARIPLIPVRSSAPISKNKIFEIMNLLANKELVAPIKMGEIVIKNVLNTGIDIIASRSLESMS